MDTFDKQLEARQVKDIYSSSVFATIVMFLLASILSYYLWEYLPHSRILGWYIINVSTIVLYYILFSKFKKSNPAEIDYKKWKRTITISFALRAVTFGSAGVLLFSQSPSPLIGLILVLAGVVSGTVGPYHMMRHIIFICCIAYAFPLSYSLFTSDIENGSILGFFTLLYIGFMVITSVKLNRSYTANLALSFEIEKANQALKESENKFKAISSYTANLDSWFSPKGELLWQSPSGQLMTGYTFEECQKIPGYPMNNMHPEDQELVRVTFNDAITNKTNGKNLEFRMLKKDGSHLWLSASWQSLYLDGEFAGIRTSSEDITERKQQGQAFKALLKLSMMYGASDEKITEYALEEFVKFTNSKVGYLHFINDDEKTLSHTSWSKETMKYCTSEKTIPYLLDDAGIWADSVRLRKPVVHNDYQTMPGKKGYPEGHVPIFRHLSAPIESDGKIVAVAGVGNKQNPYTENDATQLSLFLNSMWSILNRMRINAKLRETLEARDKLISKMDMFHKAMEATQVGITICDSEMNIIYVNDADARMHGYTVGELTGQKTVIYKSKVSTEQKDLNEIGLRDAWVRESVNIDKDGREFPVLLSSVYISDEDGKPNAMVTICEDLSDLKKNESALKSALEQRDVLIKEIHHRVKNNLAVIQSLLSLQSSESKDAVAKYALEESQSRVRAMSMIHERLYRSSDLSSIDFSEYINDLAIQLLDYYTTGNRKVSLNVDIPKISLDVDTIIPCGLIVNELLTNAFKYAFPDGRDGDISIGLETNDVGSSFLVVKDNGIGLPKGYDINTSTSLGMQIINSLSSQIGADAIINSGSEGTETKILLKKHLLESFHWIDSVHLLGINDIDEQHKGFYDEIKKLQDAIETGRSEEGLNIIIPKLVQYADDHFRTEEAYMEKLNYPEKLEHMMAHNEFKEKVNAIVSNIEDGQQKLSLKVYDFLLQWLNKHVSELDINLGVFINKHANLSSPHGGGKSLNQKQVLLIEDDRLTQKTLEKFLLKNNYSYLTASSGQNAFSAIKDYNFDLIISDYMLSDINGMEIISRMNDMGNKAPVLFITGMSPDEMPEATKGVNILSVLYKPVSFSELKEVIEAYFLKHPPA